MSVPWFAGRRLVSLTMVSTAIIGLVLASGCNETMLARAVPANFCDFIGEALLNKLAPGSRPWEKIGHIGAYSKSVSCVAQTFPNDRNLKKFGREPVKLAITMTRYGDGDQGGPRAEAQAQLEKIRAVAQERSTDQANGDVIALKYGYPGYIWTLGSVPKLRLIVRKSDTLLSFDYEPVPGVPADTAKRWLISASEQIIRRVISDT